MKNAEEIVVKYVGKLEQKEIENLIAQHGKVYPLEVEATDDGTEIAVAYLKRPDRILLGGVLAIQKTNIIRSKEMLLEACFVAGDKRILEDDEMFFAAMGELDGLITNRVAYLKKNLTKQEA